MSEPEYRMGSGPDQLPHGEATAANTAPEGTPPPDPMEGAAPVGVDPQEDAPQMATPADFEPLYDPQTDDEMFIAEPTTRPDEAQFVGAEPKKGVPLTVRKSLKDLQEAAARPGASPQLKSLVAYLLRQGA